MLDNDVKLHPLQSFHEQGISCRIPNVEDRGITINQLEGIYAEILGRCEKEKWTDHHGRLLNPEDVNLYDIIERVIKSNSSTAQCSYVETVAKGPQKPVWFVSHWWGEPVLSMIHCLKRHCLDRRLTHDTPYWICAYANNQHKIASELLTNPFEKALEVVTGTVTILDSNCTVYTRIWCIFEFYKTHLKKKDQDELFLFDIYTETETNDDYLYPAVGITDGLIDDDYGNTNIKSVRESKFPIHRIMRAANVDIEKAQATNENDMLHIKQVIQDSGVTYGHLNNLLRGIFVSGVLERLLKESTDDKMKYLDIIQHSKATNINLDFINFRNIDDVIFQQLSNRLPETITHLKFYSIGSPITKNSLQEIYKTPIKLPHLQEIKLAYNEMNDDDISLLITALKEANNKTLNWLDTGVNDLTCTGVKEISTLFPQLSNTLTTLILSKNKIYDAGVIYIAEALNMYLPKLEVLRLSNNFIGDKGAIALANAIGKHHRLEFIKINSNLIGDNGATAIAKCLSLNQSLKRFYVHDNNMTGDGLIEIAKAVKFNIRLKLLSVNSANMSVELRKELKVLEFEWKKNNTDVDFFY